MASQAPKTNTFRKKVENTPKASPQPKKPAFSFGKIELKQVGIALGIALISASIFFTIAFASYLLNGPQDQSLVLNNSDQAIRDAAKESKRFGETTDSTVARIARALPVAYNSLDTGAAKSLLDVWVSISQRFALAAN